MLAPDHVYRAALSIAVRCMECGGTDGPSEFVYTGDEESLDGWEVWFSCDRCRNAGLPHETFHRIFAEVSKESGDAGG